MDDSSDQCKLFVGGVSWETTEEILREHFAEYGTVLTSVIAKDRITGSSRGFAFVSFADPAAVDLALRDSHEILGRTVEVKKAIPRGEQQQSKQQNGCSSSRNNRTNVRNDEQFRTKKIFVGGLSANLTEEEFKTYFERFGRITDVVVMHDNVTRRPRGFGFITFSSEDAVEQVVQNNFHQLNGKQVEVKRAIPKEGNSSGSNGHNARVDNGRGSNYNTFAQGSYLPYNPPYSPGYGFSPSYGSFPGYESFVGYPYGPAYGGCNYFYGAYAGSWGGSR